MAVLKVHVTTSVCVGRGNCDDGFAGKGVRVPPD